MLVDDLREASERRKARLEPRLWFVHFDIMEIMDRVRHEHFPHLRHGLEFFFVRRGPLACICSGDNAATVYAHEVLNLSETPEEVFSTVCKHELLHLVVPRREVKGRLTSHPPEFWERECKIAPERSLAWGWLWTNLGGCLWLRPRLERIDVRPSWKAGRRTKMSAKEYFEWLESRPRPRLEGAGW
jgi:hypothetical protein